MAGAQEDNSEFSFNTAVRGFHVYHRVWLPHLGQCLRAQREQGEGTRDFFAGGELGQCTYE